jgi:hypothetical protein
VQGIQYALSLFSGLPIPLEEYNYLGQDHVGFYGPKTAAAVLAYKSNHKPPILNVALRQRSPDNIVGKLTLQSLDDDMVALERVSPSPSVAPTVPTTPVGPPVATETRVVMRKTVSKIEMSLAGAGRVNPVAPPPAGQPVLDLLLNKATAAGLATAVADRIAKHPLEARDPDFGTEKFRMERPIDTRLVMTRMDVTVTITDDTDPVSLIITAMTTTTITREYSYTYGVGMPNQQVNVTRKVVTPANAQTGAMQQVITVTSASAQPLDYKDP